METPSDPHSDSKPRRRRWPLVLLALVGLSALLLVVGPRVAAPFVRGKVVSTLEERYPVRAQLDDLGFGLPGWARLGGFELVDLEGRPFASLQSLDASARLMPLISGNVDATVRISGVEMHLRQDEQGRWNFEDFVEPSEVEPETAEEESGAAPSVSLDFELKDTRVVVHSGDRETQLRDVELSLVLDGLDQPGSYRIAANVIGPDGPGGVVRGQGEWTLLADSAGKQGGLELTIEGLLMRAFEPIFDLVLEERPPALSEPAVLDGALDLTFRADVADELDAIEITAFELASPLISGALTGRVSGLAQSDPPGPMHLHKVAGEFAYVPDRIAPLIADYLPEGASFSGAGEEQLRFVLDGPLDPAAPIEDLLRAVDADVSVGVGRFAASGLDAAGTFTVGLRDDVAQLGAELGANGGGIRFNAKADLSGAEEFDSAPLSLELDWNGVGMCEAFAPMLARLHPILAGALGPGGKGIGGLVSGELQLSYAAPFTLDALLAGELSLAPLVASGQVGIDNAEVRGAPILDRFLTQLGSDPESRRVSMEPIAFHVKAEEVTYDRDWQWTIDGTPTRFTGAFGFDQSIDMNWTVPIADGLIRRFSELESLRGQDLVVPIGGTVTAPKFALTEAVGKLAKTALESKVKEKAKDKVEELVGADPTKLLDQVLAGGGTSTSGEDPKAMLKLADSLWGKGQKSEAAKIYKRIRSEHKLSTTYLFNKKRIKSRAAHE